MTDDNVIARLTPLVKHDPLTTAGLRAYSASRYTTPRPPILSVADYRGLDAPARRRYDLQRMFSNANIDLVVTPMLDTIASAVLNRVWPNALRTAPGAVDGIVINGGSQQGKSSIALHVAGTFLLEWLEMHGMENPTPYVGGRDAHEPVVFAELPSTPTLKMLCGAVLDSLDEEWSEDERLGVLRSRVVKLLKEVGCRLLVIDEISRLKLNRLDDQKVLDMIREFMQTGATVVLVGVGVTKNGLLREGRYDGPAAAAPARRSTSAKLRRKSVEDDDEYTQTERRFQVLHVTNFGYHDARSRAEWVAFLGALGSQLRLLGMDPEHPERVLTEGALPEYIFRRTGGVVGSVHDLLKDAAFLLVDEGGHDRDEERITVELLGRVTLSKSAEDGRTDLDDGHEDIIPMTTPAPTPTRKKKGVNTVLQERARTA